MEKRCSKCRCLKPLEAFYKHAEMVDGRLNKCVQCAKADAAAHRLANLERIREYDRMRASMPHRVAKREAIMKRWAATHPDRRRAQTAVGNAIRAAKLKPWPVCALPSCGEKPEAHHPNYDAPLDVVWLCRAHHMQAHAVSRPF
jgi:hypothetical protein